MALLALIASRLLVLPGAREPFKLLAVLMQRLASRVHPDINRSRFQQQLSGSLALLLVLLVPVAIVYGFYLLSELPLVLDALILYFCLGSRETSQQAVRVAGNLQRQQLSLAREQAKPLLLRNRQQLSEMGLSKACIESLLHQQAAMLVAVLFWFLIGGGLLLLSYTVLQTAARQWNNKLPRYRYFGLVAANCYRFALIPGLVISALLLAVQTGMAAAWRNYRNCDAYYFSWSGRLLLAAGASALNCKLGGPAFYGSEKAARPRLGNGHEPSANDILRAELLINAQQNALILLFASALALYSAKLILLV